MLELVSITSIICLGLVPSRLGLLLRGEQKMPLTISHNNPCHNKENTELGDIFFSGSTIKNKSVINTLKKPCSILQ